MDLQHQANLQMLKGRIPAEAKNRLYGMRLLFATAFYKRETCVNYVVSLLASIKTLDILGVPYDYIYVSGDAYVDRAKNALIATFINKPNYTHLLLIDSDLGWDLAGFLNLLLTRGDFVAGVYPMKLNAKFPCVLENPTDWVLYDDSLAAEWVPGGFLLLSRECLQRMWDKYFVSDYYCDGMAGYTGKTANLFCCRVEDGKRIGEDVEFCRKWRALGGKIRIQPHIKFEHVADNAVIGNYYNDVILKDGVLSRQVKKEKKLQEEVKRINDAFVRYNKISI